MCLKDELQAGFQFLLEDCAGGKVFSSTNRS